MKSAKSAEVPWVLAALPLLLLLNGPVAQAQASGAAPPGEARTALSESVDVVAGTAVNLIQPDDAISIPITGEQVTTTAGTYNDIPRFLQVLPGVMFDTDSRNTYLVNGGNPLENLVLVDGVEVPNINHISTANTSGGFISMLNTDAVSGIRLHKMLYGPQYSGALSSVLEIKTADATRMGTHGDVSLGYAGADVVLERPLGQSASALFEFRKSVVSYVTDDIGIDGAPRYWSNLSKLDWKPGTRDSLSVLYLQGVDSLTITPNLGDDEDPGYVRTVYTGNRITMAGTWNHANGEHENQQVQLSYSRVRSTTLQTNLMAANALVENANLLDQPATLKYDYAGDASDFSLHAGVLGSVHGVDYQIAQPNGFPSPYRLNPAPLDPSNVSRDLHPFDAAAYAEMTYTGWKGLQLSGGGREQEFGLTHSNLFSPRFSVRSPSVLGNAYLYGGFAKYSQLAPIPTIVGVASNEKLRPITDLQMQVGAVWRFADEDRITLSVYRKLYYHYPVSTEHPSLSQADIVDPFGQPALYLPMISQGKGVASGAEIEYASSPRRRAFVQANLSSQKVMHRALDGVARRANFDMPVLGNMVAGIRVTARQRFTTRFGYHTGTPYTPFLVKQSQMQARPIYDLSQINEQRGSDYARLDLRYEYEHPIRGGSLQVYGGLDNALGRNNYYQYVIITHCSFCAPYELTQQGRFGEGGLWYRF